MSKMIDGEKVIKAIKDGIANDWSMSAREAIEIIRKYEQPVSGGDDKQPTDETLRDALQLAIYEITHLCPEENDGSHRPIISKAVLTKLRQALTQPSKPAMTMSGLEEIVRSFMFHTCGGHKLTNMDRDYLWCPNNPVNITKLITALSEAGVLNVRQIP